MGKSISIDDSAGTLINGLEISVRAAGANGKFVAVTGADGFIGSHVVNILLSKGYMVRGTVQDLDPARVDFLKLLPKASENLSLFKGELLDEGCFDSVFQGCDCVFHLASPTLKHQREMKSPEDEMIDQGVRGMLNVLQSCKKACVKAVVITSSMCAASPKPDRPRIINESHWADHEVQMKKGAYHAASKTLAERAAVEFLAKMSTESAFRLVRICPAFTVGPMLQPTVNSSMERFAAMCCGGHHERIRNDSISMIDVRDTAAHHVAAYEKGLEGRFFSTTEAWPWTLIYKALEYYCPQMNWPAPLPRGTKLLPTREYSKTRMNVLGVKERSLMKVLGDAVKVLEVNQLVRASILDVAGYYDLGSGNGKFLMVEVTCAIEPDLVVNSVQLSYVIGSETEPSIVNLPSGLLSAGTGEGDYTLYLDDGSSPNLNLKFQTMSGEQRIGVNGSINGTQISGNCYITAIPYYVFAGTYVTEDGSDTVTLLGEGSNSITFSDGTKVDKFNYDPVKRKFSYPGNDFDHRLYINVAAGKGLIIRFVQFNKDHPEGTGSTTDYFTNPKPTIIPGGPALGADELAGFAGFYPLNHDGSSFVSIMGVTEEKSPVQVGVCTDGKNSSQYSSFTFQNNTLTFPNPEAPSITFTESMTYTQVSVVPPSGQAFYGQNFFSVAPFEAFGNHTLTTKSTSTSNATLSITQGDGQSKIVYTMDGTPIFDTSDYEYLSVEQAVLYDGFRLNFCYNPNTGVTCGVTKTEGGFNSVLFAYPQ